MTTNRIFTYLAPVLATAAVLSLVGTAAARPDAVARQTVRALHSGAPGVVVAVDRAGAITTYDAGVADRETGSAVSADAHFRIGSVSKTFLATVVLQLVQEHRMSLHDSLERYLPGVLPRIDERRVTVRMLLDHTSGIPDATDQLIARLIAHPRRFFGHGVVTPARLVYLTRKLAPTHRPGARFDYSNTDYYLLAMIVRRVTGAPYTRLERTRVLDPLALRATVLPTTARTTLPAPFLHGYMPEGGRLRDWTRFNATWAGSAGGIVSTASDVARFDAALMGGRLLSPHTLKLMRGDARERAAHYGLGLWRWRTPCGREVFGHPGGMLGYASRVAATANGQISVAIGVSTNETPRTDTAMGRIVDAAVCP